MMKIIEKLHFKILLPRFIFATDDPFPIIILKDLSADGYNAPRAAFEDLEDTKLMIQRLAQFHAASYYLSEMVKIL